MPESPRRYICIHGHFYQPPRESPWLETIERQDSAYPFHDWNERILAECYRPNAAARIVDDQNRIIRIGNNYERISFNFGPTLLSWMQRSAPGVYRAILAADARSCERFSGHGSALAQVYNHIIMPLASRRDKLTQIRWGIADFRHRFGRAPEGMWLAETAVDGETLDLLAEHDIGFTILAPNQARRIRQILDDGSAPGPWCDVTGGTIEPGRVYRCATASGHSIDIFFYHGQNSNAIAFERLLDNGGRFATRLADIFPDVHPGARDGADDSEAHLSHVATDGETYGHHHRYGDMALAYALHHIERARDIELTNYGEFRAHHPARYEVEIIDDTAWSCAHGVGRWNDDCGCNMGTGPGWNQAWRRHLRQALDELRDRLAALFEERGRHLLTDPWAARDHYIEVINDRSPARVDAFLSTHAARELTAEEEVVALQLLEMQRHALLMYTSCGWFFDDFTGPEGTQILRYAARAIELGECVTGQALEEPFLASLQRARSNRPEMGDGRRVYDEMVRPARVDLRRAIAHYAVSSLFTDSAQERAIPDAVHCYRMDAQERNVHTAGAARLLIGTVRCTSTITRAASSLSFAVLHFGDYNLVGGARHFSGESAYRDMVGDITTAFERADLVATQRQLDRHFAPNGPNDGPNDGQLTFSLESLFPDEREYILQRILAAQVADAEAAYERLYAQHAPLMRYLEHFDLPIPDAFTIAARFTLKSRLRRALASDDPGGEQLRQILSQAELVGANLDDQGLDHMWRATLERLAERVTADPDDIDALTALCDVAELSREYGQEIDLWRTQNACYQLLQTVWPDRQKREQDAPFHPVCQAELERWLDLFERLCGAVHIAIPKSPGGS